jgi:transcriptional regulator with XRE-family HTH domain
MKNKLKIAIEENGWSQKEFADYSKIAHGTINKLANQRMDVSKRMMNKILITLNEHSKKGNYKLEDLFFDDTKNIV